MCLGCGYYTDSHDFVCLATAAAAAVFCAALQQVNQVTKLNAEEACPFVGESLRILRQEVSLLYDVRNCEGVRGRM
jgi:hypothetical protein